MVSILGLLLLSALTMLVSELHAVYRSLALKELHHRQTQGDADAGLLAQVVEHRASSELVLRSLVVILGAASIVVATVTFSWFFALVFIAVFIWAVFIRTPHKGKLATNIASKIAPYFAQLLLALKPLNDRKDRLIRKHPRAVHTGLYDKADLLELLESQMATPSNRIDRAELAIAQHALTFGDKVVKDYMTPRRVVRFVDGNDSVGPILINELHESGFSRFPVWGDENNVVGTLYLRDLIGLKHSGIVKNVMQPDVFYVNESSSLQSVLAAFLRTKHHLFIVVNEFEEIVGIITIEDVLEQVLGQKIVDEFDQHEDLRAVAKQQAAKNEAKEHPKPAEVKAGTTEARVVE